MKSGSKKTGQVGRVQEVEQPWEPTVEEGRELHH